MPRPANPALLAVKKIFVQIVLNRIG
jgi:hypothetical protein